MLVSYKKTKLPMLPTKIGMLMVFLFSCAFAFNSFAIKVEAHEKIEYNSLTSTPVVIGQSSATSHLSIISNTPTQDIYDKYVKDFITIGINHNMLSVFDDLDYKLKVRVTVTATNLQGVPIQVNNGLPIDLLLDVKPFTTRYGSLDKFTFQFKDAYQYTLTITNIWKDGIAITNLPHNVFINSEIEAERYIDFSDMIGNTMALNPPELINTDCDMDGSIDEFKISWPTVINAEEYQLEWTFVNDYAAVTNSYLNPNILNFDFKNNSTRITINSNANSYKITNIYEHGYFLYRVRAVGRELTNTTISLYSNWSTNDFGLVSSIYPSNKSIFINSTNVQLHEQNKNWQFSATYAEDGKKKEVINYFDGSLRNRQSVTKINSDNNVVVGETIYDYQGRGAINVLPTPVTFPNCTTTTDAAPSIKYYEQFNLNNPTTSSITPAPYNRADFDLDVNNNCTVATPPMSPNNGASNYYSPSNSNLNEQQKFVPDAKGYPFTQIEYTPDNTGRIARQSGVGEDYVLGSGHETKYFYGSPAQVQLNRMFGSEVGDASRYKKNLIVDANGQISISYLDQEGRTIATSLAGNPPVLTNGTYPLAPIASALNEPQELHVDLFHEDLNGNSLVNNVTPTYDAIVFNQQLLMDASGAVQFNYDLNVSEFLDPCLKEGVCISCVYNLEIRVTDECANNLVSPEINHQVGTFSSQFDANTNQEVIVFNCIPNNSNINHTESFTLGLQVGSYTISKILTLNQDAVDLYTQAYINTAYNSCVVSQQSFIDSALANLDTSSCFVSCESCLSSLGPKDDFVAQGKGTSAQYDILAENCQKPCKTTTLCEATYQMLLSDVRPGGQYAEYTSMPNVYDPQSFPLSVLFTNNSLPNNIATHNAHWRNPVAEINGQNYNGYFEEDGTRSIIVLSPNQSTTWLPEVMLGVSPVYDAVNGYYTVYPEQLANISDFIFYFKTSWSKSLVQYHPEYCYYKSCSEFSKIQGSDVLTSDEFDQKLREQTTFYKANNTPNDFIKSNYQTFSANNRLQDFINDIPDNPAVPSSISTYIDPFFAPNSSYQINLTAAGSSLNLHQAMKQKLLSYSTYTSSSGPVNISMAEAAAILQRCPSNFVSAASSNCSNFGAVGNNADQNGEWKKLTIFYLGEKAKLQNLYETEIANLSCHTNNVCIGNDDYSPSNSGMTATNGNITTAPYFDPQQPCSAYYYHLYLNKVKRFINEDDIPIQSVGDAEYQTFLQTGQCPTTFHFQNLLTALATAQKLTAINEPLANHPEFTPHLYDVLNGGPNITGPVYIWELSNSTSTILEAKIVDIQNPLSPVAVANIQIEPVTASSISWNSIQSIIQFVYSGSGMYEFTAQAGIMSNGVLTYIPIRGKTSINIQDCEFEDVCKPNQFAIDLSTLLSAVAGSGNLLNEEINLDQIASSQNPPVTNFDYNDLITPVIHNTLGSTSNPLFVWTYAGNNIFKLYSLSGEHFEIKFTAADPSSFTLNDANLALINSFSNVNSNNFNLFKIDAYNAAGLKLATLDGVVKKINLEGNSTPVEMGECGLPTPITCQTNGHMVREDLEDLIDNLGAGLTNPDYENQYINLFNNPYLTPNLIGNLPPLAELTTSHFNDQPNASPPFQDLTFVFEKSECELNLHLETGVPQVSFNQFVGITNDPLVATGAPDANGDLYNFIVEGIFNVNGNNIIRTITGSSCFPLQNCDPCPKNGNPSTDSNIVVPPIPIDQQRLPYDSLSFVKYDSLQIVEGKTIIDNSYAQYRTYLLTIDSINTGNGNTPGDSSYLIAASYVDYSITGSKLNSNTQLTNIKFFDPQIDNADKTAQIVLFALNYGARVNASIEYERYVKAINKYNVRALSVQGATILTPLAVDLFDQYKLADRAKEYISYLKQLPSMGNYAQDILPYFGLTQQQSDDCVTLYKQYAEAYKEFETQQTINLTCKEYKTISPFLSYEEFLKNNLCCSQDGIDLLNAYIVQLIAGTPCPGPLPSMRDCNSSTPGTTTDGECQNLYTLYKKAIAEYNASPYAIANNHQLDFIATWQRFLESNYCGCIKDYIIYLQDYIVASSNSPLPLPFDLKSFPGCNLPEPIVTSDECKDKYDQYLVAVAQYQQFAQENGLPQISIVKYDEYLKNGYCNCVDKYISLLQNIVANNIIKDKELFKNLLFEENCQTTLPPCAPSQPQTPYVSPPYPGSQHSDCVQQLINTATFNAGLAYQQYINNIANDFAIKYRQHCMSALEDFFVDYDDKEYHFTLYYYDQAGNLVKTVPPEGIKLLDTNSDTDYTGLTLKQDRLLNKQSIFTEHQLATTYEYNSLNQLVKQNMPDHETMDVFGYTLPNGLDVNLNITSIQYISASSGYLTGTITTTLQYGANSIARGYLYTTNDGGQNWTKVNDLMATNINKLQMLDATNGYAVCNNGILLRTSDGGANWDLIPLYVNNYYDASVLIKRTPENLNDLSFHYTANNSIEGVIVGDNGTILYTANGGNTFFRSSGVEPFENITAVTYDGAAYYLTTKFDINVGLLTYSAGNIYKATSLSTGFTKQDLSASDLKSVCWYNGNNAYAVGKDGTLLRFNNGDNTWYIVPTGQTQNILDVYFRNELLGVAIFETTPNTNAGNIYKTEDGGLTWTLLSLATDNYTSLNKYDNDKLIAVGKNGLVARVLLTYSPFGIIKLTTVPGNPDLNFGDAQNYSAGAQMQIMAVANDNKVYICDNGINTPGSPNVWTTITISNTSIPNATSGFKKVLVEAPPNGNKFNGVLLTNDGKAYPFTRNATDLFANTTSSITIPSGTGTIGYADMIFKGGAYYLLNNNDKSLTYFELTTVANATSPPSVVGIVTKNAVSPFAYTINALHINGANELAAVGNDGAIFTSVDVTNSGTNLTWTDYTTKVTAAALNDISALQQNQVYAVGDDGYEFYCNNNIVKPINLGIRQKLNAIKTNVINTDYTAYIAGDTAFVHFQTLNGLSTTSIPVNMPVVSNITDIAYKKTTTESQIYFTCESGEVVHSSTFTANTPTLCITTSPYKINGVCFTYDGSNNVMGTYTGGDFSTMYNFSGLAGIKQNNIKSPALKDVNFINAQEGYVVGNYGYIRHTINGSNQFNVVPPFVTKGGFTPKLNAVLTTHNNHAAIVGQNANINGMQNKGYLGNVNANNIPVGISVPATDKPINDIEGNPSFMAMAADAGQIYTAVPTATTYTAFTNTNNTINVNLNAVHVFRDNSYIICGVSSYVSYTKINGARFIVNTNLPAGLTLNDIYFHDDRMGYVVGNSGAFYKINYTVNIQNITSGTSNSWAPLSLNDNFGVPSPITTPSININTIAFTSRYNGIIGGNQTISTVNYARLINDESNYYSTRFWYDKLGRMVLSQNTKQFNKIKPGTATPPIHGAFSYTLYDALGRITEVGEKIENTSAPKFQTIFGTLISGFYNPLAIDDANFNTWVTAESNTTRTEITRTYYDVPLTTNPTIVQNNLRKRVAIVTYEDVFDGNNSTFEHASHYAYDIHGNVNTLWQENKKIAALGTALQQQSLKRIDYNYDLISGKVNKVVYQNGQPDMFIHKYNYDADNRITSVQTSRDGVNFDEDANYIYYAHGPLARVETGDLDVQGTDYAYTLQGWIKGTNSTLLEQTHDMGNDGSASGTLHEYFARDAFSYALNYYSGDYQAIQPNWTTSTNKFVADAAPNSDIMSQRFDLYNGNINSMYTTILKPQTLHATTGVLTPLPQGMAYKYDQLNRLLHASAYSNLLANNTWETTANQISTSYLNDFTYDANGNIEKQKRYGASGNVIEDLTYNYYQLAQGKQQNRLYSVNDTYNGAASLTHQDIDDIIDQGPFQNATATIVKTQNNFSYDDIGNLIKDASEEIAEIKWTVYGKIKAVIRTPSSSKKSLSFDYDASGNRIAKHVYSSSTLSAGTLLNSTYYLRDAQGNNMAVYKLDNNSATISSHFKLEERYIYGSNRLGMDMNKVNLFGLDTSTYTQTDTLGRWLGSKQYEFSNHLGNVLTTISDKKIPRDDNQDGIIDYFNVDLQTISDYYPFGASMKQRSFHLITASTGGPLYVDGTYTGANFEQNRYRPTFNSKESDPETGEQDYGMRMYYSNLGRFPTIDPLSDKFSMLSPYQFASNTPIWAIDLDGLEARVYTDQTTTLPHTFISVIDKEGILNVYTFGQYGQNGVGLGAAYNTGSSLVNLKGPDAENYIRHEFESFPISVYEISKNVVDKKSIIDYYSIEMKNYPTPATKVKPHAPSYANVENGSVAVKYKPYFLTPNDFTTENCVSVATDGLKAGGIDLKSTPAIPQMLESVLKAVSNTSNMVKDVTDDAEASVNPITLPEVIITPN